MTMKYGQATLFIIDVVEDTTFFALKSNVGYMFIEVPNCTAVIMAEHTAEKLGAEFGNFAIRENGEEKTLEKTDEFEVPAFTEINDSENNKLKALSMMLSEYNEKEFKGIEVRGEAGWALPYDERRYFKKSYTNEGELFGITVEADITNDRIRCSVECDGDVVNGLWFNILSEISAFKLDLDEVLENTLDWFQNAENYNDMEENEDDENDTPNSDELNA